MAPDDDLDDDVPPTLRTAVVAHEGAHAHDAHPSATPAHEEPTDRRIPVAVEAAPEHGSLLVLTGRNAGQLCVLERLSTIVGRHPDCDLWLEDTSVSRRHARIAQLEAEARYQIEDLGSHNGTFVSGRRVTRAELTVGDRIQVGRVLMRFGVTDAHEDELRQRLYASSTRDALTHVHNRAHFEERLESELAYAHRHDAPLSLLAIDVGAPTGHGPKVIAKRTLRMTAATLSSIVRTEDLLARYGGDRFVVLVRGIGAASARLLADRLARSVAEACPDAHLRIGIASLSDLPPKATGAALVAAAIAAID